MKCDVVVDLQYGSTGKGAAVQHLIRERKYEGSVRVQSIQAGHTIYYNGKPIKMRTIPCAWLDQSIKLILGAGCFIEKELLLHEVQMIKDATGEDVRSRLILDFRASYVLPEDFEAEKGLDGKIGSTAHGAGASLIRKMWRRTAPARVIDDTWATDNGFIVMDTIRLMQDMDTILLEGCQGTMLSIHTSPYYPFVTAREASVSGIMSEAGISPKDIRDIIGVFRSLPIRVGGNSGNTGGRELDWAEVNRRAGREIEPERTTVTNRVRRIFEFSHKDFEHAMIVNKPTHLFMTFADYMAPGVYGHSTFDDMPADSAAVIKGFIQEIEDTYGVKVNWVATGEMPEHVINRA